MTNSRNDTLLLQKGPLIMPKLITLFLTAGLTLLVACTAPAVSQDSEQPQNMPLIDSWSGDYPVAALDQLPTGLRQSPIGYIGDDATFKNVWKAFMPAEPVPTIDFGENLVVFSRNVDYYNRTNIIKVVLDADGVVEILAMQTLSAIPIRDKAAMAMAVIPRAGIIRLKTGENTSIPVE
jgi:hypothetical protein